MLCGATVVRGDLTQVPRVSRQLVHADQTCRSVLSGELLYFTTHRAFTLGRPGVHMVTAAVNDRGPNGVLLQWLLTQ